MHHHQTALIRQAEGWRGWRLFSQKWRLRFWSSLVSNPYTEWQSHSHFFFFFLFLEFIVVVFFLSAFLSTVFCSLSLSPSLSSLMKPEPSKMWAALKLSSVRKKGQKKTKQRSSKRRIWSPSSLKQNDLTLGVFRPGWTLNSCIFSTSLRRPSTGSEAKTTLLRVISWERELS